MINYQLPWPSDVDFQIICIADHISIARSHLPVSWSADGITGIMLSNIPLIFEKILALTLRNI